jgi:hypothetical protein
MENFDHDLVKRNTVAQLVESYQKACKEVQAAWKLLYRAEERSGDALPKNHYGECGDAINRTLHEMKRGVWRKVINMLNVRQMMSTKQAEKLDKQLHEEWNYHMDRREELPEITVVNIWQTIKGLSDNLPQFQTEAIQEAFDHIRRCSDGYKSTDGMFKVGEKAVLTWIVESNWNGGGMRVTYSSEQRMRVVENAFRLLEGKGPAQTNKCELSEKLQAGNEGETEYYRFRAFKNRNLHIWFKRMDLVAKLNEIGAQGRKELDKVA